jgi:hypothetical protein
VADLKRLAAAIFDSSGVEGQFWSAISSIRNTGW